MSQTFKIETLGCKANQYDSERLAEALSEAGLHRAHEAEGPDIWVVNTCTVTHVSDRKCRQTVRQAIREHPDAQVYVTGCYATSSPDELEEIEGVTGVYGREELDELIESITGERPGEPTGDFGLSDFAGRARAMLKVQEGCDFFCNYCIVPHVRGEPRSMPLDSAVREAGRLVEKGFREIVLTGIHLGLYGRDLGSGVNLAELVRAVACTDGLERLRLSSLEAPEVSDELLRAMTDPVVCPHLHLPLQSGDDRVLERMGRRYTTLDFRHYVRRAREILSEPAITTDVLVGFPGESDEEFENTLGFCGEMKFSRMHVFKFSPREGTPAAEMDGQVHSRVAKKRSARLRKLGGRLARDWAEQFVGQTVRVLLEETTGEGKLCGYTDRYVRVLTEGREGDLERLRCVKVESSRDGVIHGAIERDTGSADTS